MCLYFYFIDETSVSLCASVVKNGEPQRHQDTKNLVENVVQQRWGACAIGFLYTLKSYLNVRFDYTGCGNFVVKRETIKGIAYGDGLT